MPDNIDEHKSGVRQHKIHVILFSGSAKKNMDRDLQKRSLKASQDVVVNGD